MKSNDAYKSMSLYYGAFFSAILFVILGLAGCQREGPAEKAGQKIDQAAEQAGKKLEGAKESLGETAISAGSYLDDSAITTKIKAEILSDPLIKSSQINVITTKGVVKLSGVVDSQQSIDRAMEIARSNPAVKSVENNLALKGAR